MPKVTTLCSQIATLATTHPKMTRNIKVTMLVVLTLSGVACLSILVAGSLSLAGGVPAGPLQSLHFTLLSTWEGFPVALTVFGGSGALLHLLIPVGLVVWKMKRPSSPTVIPNEKIESEKELPPAPGNSSFATSEESSENSIDCDDVQMEITEIFKSHHGEMKFKDDDLAALYEGNDKVEGFQLKRDPAPNGKTRKKLRRVITETLVPGGLNDLFVVDNYRKHRTEVLRLPKSDVDCAEELFDSGIPIHKKVAHLPHILKVYSVFQNEDEDTKGVLLEYCDKGDLYKALESKKYELELLLHLCAQTAEGLVALHKAKVVHGDIKPENILLKSSIGDSTVKVRIGDFDMAGHIGDEVPTARGTLHYLPPEIKAGIPMIVSPRLDTWAFGLVLFTVFCSHFPTGLNHVSARFVTDKSKKYWDETLPEEINDHLTSREKELEDFEGCDDIVSAIRGLLTIDPADSMSMDAAFKLLQRWL